MMKDVDILAITELRNAVNADHFSDIVLRVAAGGQEFAFSTTLEDFVSITAVLCRDAQLFLAHAEAHGSR